MEVKKLERIFKKSMVISLLRKFPIPILRNLFKRILIILSGRSIGSPYERISRSLSRRTSRNLLARAVSKSKYIRACLSLCLRRKSMRKSLKKWARKNIPKAKMLNPDSLVTKTKTNSRHLLLLPPPKVSGPRMWPNLFVLLSKFLCRTMCTIWRTRSRRSSKKETKSQNN